VYKRLRRREEIIMQVREIMKREFRSIARDATVRDAARLMSETGIGMLPVEDRKEIVGTVTDRDITIRATASGADPNTTPVSEVMSNKVFTCVEEDELQQAAQIMEDNQIRRLMVQNDKGEFVGMLTIADLARQPGTARLLNQVVEQVSQPGIAH
jgi:CBS domain-containing protein